MPYCEPCARHWTPSSMRADGSCPSCGLVLARPKLLDGATGVAGRRPVEVPSAEPGHDAAPAEVEAEEAPKAPWHFKVLLAALVVYLGFRAVQGVEWVAARF